MEYRVEKLRELSQYIARGITPKYTEDLNGIFVANQKCIRNYKLSLENARIHDINQKGITSEKIAQRYDILINSTGVGTAGRVAQNFEDKKFTVDSHITIVRPDSTKIDPIYLGYILKNQQMHIERLAEGSTGQTEISRQRLGEEIIIKYPQSIEIQKRISDILLRLDQKIELNIQINDKLLKIIKIQYFNMMNEITNYNNVKLKDIAIISSGKRPRNKGTEFNIPLIGASGMMNYTETYNHNKDIIIIGRVGTLGVIQRYFDKIWASDNTLTIKTNFPNIVENYMSTIDYNSLNRGSTQPLITQTDISNLDIKYNKESFEKFESNIKNMREKVRINQIQNNILQDLRDTLLPRLINGEIKLCNDE